ncbi:MAG: hypothetical protein HYZ50_14785 [Deltaproteobacteria bacterium]|nr:hypothetical protein [Deltaproteobacteria bacterium]
MSCVTFQHIGTLLIFIGTLALAFAVHSENQYEKGLFQEIEANNKDKQLFSLARTKTNPWFFWGGIVLIAIGTIMTW